MIETLNKIRIEGINKKFELDLIFTLQKAIGFNKMASTIYPTKVQSMFFLYSFVRKILGNKVDDFLFKFGTNEAGTGFFNVTGKELIKMLLCLDINFYKDYKFGDILLLAVYDQRFKNLRFEKV